MSHRILWVDDRPTIADLKTHLEELGAYQITWVMKGEQALQRVREGQFDIAIVDMELGVNEENGLQLAARLRSEPNGQALIFVALSGLPQHREQALAQGFVEFLLKPIEARQLHEALVRALSKREQSLSEWHTTPSGELDVLNVSLGGSDVSVRSYRIAASEAHNRRLVSYDQRFSDQCEQIEAHVLEPQARELYSALFPGRAAAGHSGYRLICEYAGSRGRVLISASGDEAGIPWELALCDSISATSSRSFYLGVDPYAVVSRAEQLLPTSWKERVIRRPVNALVIAAQSDADSSLALGNELMAIREIMGPKFVSEWRILGPDPILRLVKGAERAGQATYANISSCIRRFRPVIVHFLGHGIPGEVKLDVGSWRSAFVEMAFAESGTQLVVFNCCWSGSISRAGGHSLGMAATRANVPAVVTHMYPIRDQDARVFAAHLYRSIAAGLAIDFAVQVARTQMFSTVLSDAHRLFLPIVHVRDQFIRFGM